MEQLAPWVALAASIMEGAGVVAMLLGAFVAAAFAIGRLRRDGRRAAYRSFRQSLGRAILLGLEFLVAADIIRTVNERPTLQGMAILAAVVAIRTFLSFTLEVELEGRWPWQRGRRERARGASADRSTVAAERGLAGSGR